MSLRRLTTLGGGLIALITALVWSPAGHAQDLPSAISDGAFWRLVTELSEPGGAFPAQLMSNEDSAEVVVPALKTTMRRGGVYIGVGSEQNFTYIAATEPRVAFIVDIRRDNMLEHLMYKALFELAADRADFVSRLFSRKRPPGLDDTSSVDTLFDAYQRSEPDPQLTDETVRAALSRLVTGHHFPLVETDQTAIARFMGAFRTAGPYSLKGYGDTTNPTYAQLMGATDLAGRHNSYLASEDNFRKVQALERQNLIVPLVGDFAGDTALAGVGRYLKARDAIVTVFYVSNVERYLFEQGDHGKQFYANVAALPIDESSLFIRSVTVDISRRLGIPIPDGPAKWRSFLFSMGECLKALVSGRIQTYRDLFDTTR